MFNYEHVYIIEAMLEIAISVCLCVCVCVGPRPKERISDQEIKLMACFLKVAHMSSLLREDLD